MTRQCLVGIWGCVERGMVGGAGWWRLLGGCFVLAAFFTALHSTLMHCAFHFNALHGALYFNELNCTSLHCTILYFSFVLLHLQCIALHRTMLHFSAHCTYTWQFQTSDLTIISAQIAHSRAFLQCGSMLCDIARGKIFWLSEDPTDPPALLVVNNTHTAIFTERVFRLNSLVYICEAQCSV